MNPDHDLLEQFVHQRRSDHEQAPAWNPDLLCSPARPPASPRRMPAWLPISATAVACALLSVVWLRNDSKPSADLASALPELFTTQGAPLFASLDSSAATPSDSFLPVHLTIQLP